MPNRIFKNTDFKPLLSLLIILSTLFVTAFLKITGLRLSYSLYQENQTFDQIQDKHYSQLKIYGKMTKPSRLESLAKQQELSKKKKGQVIQVIDGKALIVD